MSYAQNKEDAEEITQEVFEKIFKNASQFRGDSKVTTWVYRITVNTAINHVKRKDKWNLFKREYVQKRTNFDHPGVLLENKEKANILFEAVDQLPPNQKMAFILSFIEELPRKEVADIMEISLKAVESLLQRGKKSLRRQLKSRYPDQN